MHAFLARRAHTPPAHPGLHARVSTAAALVPPPRPCRPRCRPRHRRCPPLGRPAAAAAAAATEPSTAAPADPAPRKQHNFDAEAERQAAIDAAREAFRGAREAALEKNANFAAQTRGKLLLAPLTRGGNLPFRRLCADFGCDAAVSEMVFARNLVGKGGSGRGASAAERARLRRAPGEKVFGVQIATNEIREGAAAARLAAESGASFVSLNCGCPIYEATRRGLGASLLRKPTKLARLVAGLVAESPLPVEVKVRTGPGESNVNAPFVAALLEAAGAAAVTIHGRTMEQRYRKAADWSLIREVARQRQADALATGLPPVPIIGNGDVLTWYELERRGIYLGGRGDGAGDGGGGGGGVQQQDGGEGGPPPPPPLMHAVMAGRGALVKPWLWTEARERRELFLSARDRVGVYRQLVAHMKAHFGDDDKGRKKAWYFLPWHFNFFHRYRPFPREKYEPLSLTQPLLSTRVSLWDDGKEAEGAEGVEPLERVLRCENERAYEAIAGALWDAASDADAAAALERLGRDSCRDWERELYEQQQQQASGRDGRGGGDGRVGGGGGASSSDEGEEVEG